MDSTTWLSIGARPFFDWWIVGSMNGFVVFCKCNGEECEMTSEKCGIWSQVLDFRIVWRWCFVSSKTDSRPKRITCFFFGVKEKRLIFRQTWLPSSRQWNFNQISGQGKWREWREFHKPSNSFSSPDFAHGSQSMESRAGSGFEGQGLEGNPFFFLIFFGWLLLIHWGWIRLRLCKVLVKR